MQTQNKHTHTHTTPSKPAAQALRDVKARGCLAGDWNSPLPSRTSGQVVKRQQLLSSLVADRFALSTTACIQRLPRCYLQPVQPRLTQTRRPMTQLFRAAAKGPITNLAQLRACKPFFVGTETKSSSICDRIEPCPALQLQLGSRPPVPSRQPSPFHQLETRRVDRGIGQC